MNRIAAAAIRCTRAVVGLRRPHSRQRDRHRAARVARGARATTEGGESRKPPRPQPIGPRSRRRCSRCAVPTHSWSRSARQTRQLTLTQEMQRWSQLLRDGHRGAPRERRRLTQRLQQVEDAAGTGQAPSRSRSPDAGALSAHADRFEDFLRRLEGTVRPEPPPDQKGAPPTRRRSRTAPKRLRRQRRAARDSNAATNERWGRKDRADPRARSAACAPPTGQCSVDAVSVFAAGPGVAFLPRQKRPSNRAFVAPAATRLAPERGDTTRTRSTACRVWAALTMLSEAGDRLKQTSASRENRRHRRSQRHRRNPRPLPPIWRRFRPRYLCSAKSVRSVVPRHRQRRRQPRDPRRNPPRGPRRPGPVSREPEAQHGGAVPYRGPALRLRPSCCACSMTTRVCCGRSRHDDDADRRRSGVRRAAGSTGPNAADRAATARRRELRPAVRRWHGKHHRQRR